MPIDPRIPLMGQPVQLENPLNSLAKFETIRAAQRQNALADLKMKQYDVDMANRNQLRSYLSSADLGTPEGKRGLLRFGEEGRVTGKALSEQEKSEATRQKTETDAIEGRLTVTRRFLDTVQTPDQAVEWLNMSYADPVLGKYLKSVGATPEKSISDLSQAAQTPEGFQEWKMNAAMGTEKLMEHRRIMRGQDVTMRGQDISAATQRRGQDINAEVQLRGQDLTNEREWWKARKSVLQKEKANDLDFQKDLARVKAIGKKEGETLDARRKELVDLDTTIGLITDVAATEVDPNNPNSALIKQSTSGGAGSIIDGLVEFFGGSTDGDIAIAKLQPIADKVLKQVPRFEGPQGVLDVQSYEKAAGDLANPWTSREKRREAALTIVSLMKKRRNQLTGGESASPGAPSPSSGGVGLNAPVGGVGLPPGAPIPPPVPNGVSLPPGYSIEWEQ